MGNNLSGLKNGLRLLSCTGLSTNVPTSVHCCQQAHVYDDLGIGFASILDAEYERNIKSAADMSRKRKKEGCVVGRVFVWILCLDSLLCLARFLQDLAGV